MQGDMADDMVALVGNSLKMDANLDNNPRNILLSNSFYLPPLSIYVNFVSLCKVFFENIFVCVKIFL